MANNEIMDILHDDPTDVLRRCESDLTHSTEYRRWYANKWYRFYRKYRSKHDEEFLKFRGDKFTIFVPLIFSLIETIIPRFVLGTFGTYPYINVVPTGSEDIEPAKKAEQLLNTQLSQDNIIIKAPGWFKQFSMYGTSPAKVRWKADYATFPMRNGKSSRQVLKYLGPTLEPLDVFDLSVDPKATDAGITSAGYLIHTIILSEEDMKDRVKNAKKYGYSFAAINWQAEGMNGNSELWEKMQRERAMGISQRESPDRKYWRFDEYWTPTAIITILNRRHILRRSPNLILDYPFINLNRNPLLGDFYGIGDIEPVEDLMDEINYIRNLRLDNMDILVNGMWAVERSAQVNAEELIARAGKIVYTNDIAGIKPLVFPDMSGPARSEEMLLKQELNETAGLMDPLKGQDSKGNQPAAGLAMLIEGASYRIKLGLMMIEHHGIRQIGEKFMRMNYLNLPSNHITRLVGSSDWLKLKSADEVFGNYDFIPYGSSEFINKEALRQSLLQLYNLLARDPSVDQVGLKKLMAMAFGGRLVESILLGKNSNPQAALPEGADTTATGGADEGEMIQKENEQMLNGEEVPPIGNHGQHIEGHTQLMQQPEFAQLNSGVQGIVGRHLEGHQRAIASDGAPLEDPQRFAANVGKGQEEAMKSSLQRPTAG
jgi:hypothetical protein